MSKMMHYIPVLVIILLFACTPEETETSDAIVFAPVHVMEVRNGRPFLGPFE